MRTGKRSTASSRRTNPEGVRERGSEGDLTSFKRYFLNIWDRRINRALELAKVGRQRRRMETPGLLPKLPEDKVRTLPHDFMARSSSALLGRRRPFDDDRPDSVVFLFRRRRLL